MSTDREPEGVGRPEDGKLPSRPDDHALSEAARDRMLERVIPGGLAPAEPSEPGRVGRYQLMRRLGHGGMGEVWDVADSESGKRMALKMLRTVAAAHEPTRRRFLREARTAASVRHPHIVRIFDVGTSDAGVPFIVMELLTGESLEHEVRHHGPLPWSRALAILLQVADALELAHSQGVVHRDLKPANVMLVGGSDSDDCKIIDFGLAKREILTSASEALSRTGEVFGSPPFMSPEQFRGEEVDARTDLYSYGCLMFYVLTGKRPFPGEKIGELMYSHLFEPAPTPTGLSCPERLVPAVESIILRALRKSPEHRFASMGEVAETLRRLEHDPTPVEVPRDELHPPASATQAPAPEPRRATPWLVAGAAVLAGAAATVWAWQDGDPPPDDPTPANTEQAVPTAPADPPRERPQPPPPQKAEPPEPERAPEMPNTTRKRKPERSRTKPRPTKEAVDEPEPAKPASDEAKDGSSELPPNPFRSGSPSGRQTP